MFLDDLVGSLLGDFLVGLFGGWRRRRGHARAEEYAALAKPVTLTAAIRLLDRRFIAGRWRHGKAVIHAGEIRWAPRWPRMGRSFVLRDAVFRGRRRPTTPEELFLHPGLVIVECVTASGSYELAVFPEDLGLLRSEAVKDY